jgi:uncharacterized protein (TIGR02246 family)
MAASATDLEAALARIRELEDERDIRRLASEYCHGFDRWSPDRFASVWHEDAVWRLHPEREVAGRAAILAEAREMWRRLSASFHWTANHVVEVDGDVAHGEADVDVLVCVDGVWANAPGVYVDRYERRDGTWRIAHRDASHAHQAFLPLRLDDAAVHGR